MKSDQNWKPLKRAVVDAVGFSAQQKAEAGMNEVWMNNLYTVFVRRGMKFIEGGMSDAFSPSFTWLSIKRNDKAPAKDWRHFQFIKNQLVGEENEGAELYPKESRLVDGSNQYHLWCLENPDDTFPFGFFEGRTISENPLPGGKQRPWPGNMKPKDLKEQEEKTANQLKEFQNRKS